MKQSINIILNKFFKKLKEYNFYNILLVNSSFCIECFVKYKINYLLLLLFDVLTINATPIKITIVEIIVR